MKVLFAANGIHWSIISVSMVTHASSVIRSTPPYTEFISYATLLMASDS